MPCLAGFYTLTGVSAHDTPKITTLPGPCPVSLGEKHCPRVDFGMPLDKTTLHIS